MNWYLWGAFINVNVQLGLWKCVIIFNSSLFLSRTVNFHVCLHLDSFKSFYDILGSNYIKKSCNVLDDMKETMP